MDHAVTMSMTKKKIEEIASEHYVKVPALKKKELVDYINGAIYDKSRNKYNNSAIQKIHTEKIHDVWMDTNVEWMEHLKIHGWAVVDIPDYVDYRENFFQWLEKRSPRFVRDDPSTWKNLPANTRGIFKEDVGFEDWVWKIRESCLPIFSKIYDCEQTDLLCSFDGGCFFPTSNKKETISTWFHHDTPRMDRNNYCVQGIVNMASNFIDDGGLLLIEESHNVYDKYMEDHQSAGYVWEKCDIDDPILKEKRVIHICAPAGTITLFNGKLFHCNYKGRHCETTQPPENDFKYRMCVYVSMQPRMLATENELELRKKLYNERKMTGHWCYGPYLKANQLGRYGTIIKKSEKILQNSDDLSDVRKRMIGY